jgi:hypothetical protein
MRASAVAKDERRELYLLSKLQTISSWRGKIVDDVITNRLVPTWNQKRTVRLDEAVAYANELFNVQLEFASNHRLRDPGLVVSKVGEAFAAFHCMEYDQSLSMEEIEIAWSEVEQALQTLFIMPELLSLLSSATYIVAQRPLTFPFADVTVRAVPDLVAFYDNLPPLVVDWKVHVFGTQDYRLQLAIYAMALSRGKPHKDFPTQKQWRPEEIRLLEIQMLTGYQRFYTLTEDDIENVEAYMIESAIEMKLALDQAGKGPLQPWNFPTTRYPENCLNCPFRKPCWEDMNDRSSNQHLSDSQPGLAVLGVPAVPHSRPKSRSRRILSESASHQAQTQLSFAEPGDGD